MAIINEENLGNMPEILIQDLGENAVFMTEDDLIEEDVEEFPNEMEETANLIVEEELPQDVLIEECSIDIISEHEVELADVRESSAAKSTSYVCATCHQLFLRQSEYRAHIRDHGHKRFNCIQCNAWFPTLTRLQKHENCHKNDVELHNCPHCERTYREKGNMKRHIQNSHGELRFVCSLCEQAFGRPDVLKNHMVKHVTERHYECPTCGSKFKSVRYLEIHMKTHEKSPDSTASYIQPKSLENENNGNQNNRLTAKRHECPYCGKISKHHYTHQNHLRTHTLERPFACNKCTKAFRTNSALKTHTRIHDDARPYQCEYCPTSFRQSSHLKEHRRLHNGIMPFVCNICKREFTKKSNLTAHRLVHTGERPQKCGHCDKKFAKISMLRRHQYSVHKLDLVESINVDAIADAQIQEDMDGAESDETHIDKLQDELSNDLIEFDGSIQCLDSGVEHAVYDQHQSLDELSAMEKTEVDEVTAVLHEHCYEMVTEAAESPNLQLYAMAQ